MSARPVVGASLSAFVIYPKLDDMAYESRGRAVTQILPLTPEDIPEKAEVHARTWQETYRGLLPDDLNDTITPQFAEDVTRRLTDLRTLVAKVDGRVVGYIAWSDRCRSHFSVDGAAEVCNLYVLQEFQGRGIGRALLEAALSRIGGHDVVLSAFSSNAPALGFYEHVGFERTGVTFDEGAMEETELVLRASGGA